MHHKIKIEEIIKQSTWHNSSQQQPILQFDKDNEYKHFRTKNILTQGHEDHVNDMFEGKKDSVKIGSLVMTPKGIARIIKIEGDVNNPNTLITVKFVGKKEKEESFGSTDVSVNFPLLVKITNSEFDLWIRIMVSAADKIESIFKIMEMQGSKTPDNDFSIVFEGSKLREDTLFEQIPSLRAFSRVLLLPVILKSSSFGRFDYNYTWWSVYREDGVSFTVNKPIRLTGVNVYKQNESKNMNINLCVYEGDSSGGLCLYSTTLNVPFTNNDSDCFINVNFTNSVKIKPELVYTIMYSIIGADGNTCYYTYYGSGGKISYDLEDGLVFTFKDLSGMSSYSTGGNFSHFFYSS